jgi:predicted DNA-binding protein YlxM (UPF0122 family)
MMSDELKSLFDKYQDLYPWEQDEFVETLIVDEGGLERVADRYGYKLISHYPKGF